MIIISIMSVDRDLFFDGFITTTFCWPLCSSFTLFGLLRHKEKKGLHCPAVYKAEATNELVMDCDMIVAAKMCHDCGILTANNYSTQSSQLN